MIQDTFLKRQYVDPRITLVGAGPGDPDLISLKGVNALKTANVVLYDALVDERLLTYAPSESIKVYVGNPTGDENFSQDVVNQLMVDYALNFGHVVRLKGGDLFVFGRGYEDLIMQRPIVSRRRSSRGFQVPSLFRAFKVSR